MEKAKLTDQLKSSLVLFLISFLFFSCQEDTDIVAVEHNEQKGNFVGIEEAAELASILKYPVNDNWSSNSSRNYSVSSSKKIEDVTPIPDENGNTVYYIINYEDYGFIILSADNRTKPVLAFSNTGKFPVNQTYPGGLELWLSNTKDFIKNVRKSNKKQTKAMAFAWADSTIQKTITPGIYKNKNSNFKMYPEPPYECEDVHENIGPLMTTEWSQYHAYNDQCPNYGCSGDGRAPAGCVAIAMAQLMRYHQHPSSYNWTQMPNLPPGTSTIADLVRDIGNAVNMAWGCGVSKADEDDMAPSLTNDFSYSSASFDDYSSQTLKNNIRSGRPVILVGYNSSSGHAWVCGGFKRYQSCETGAGYLKLYMNWGWGGSYNGWYNYNDWGPGSSSFNNNRGMVYNIIP